MEESVTPPSRPFDAANRRFLKLLDQDGGPLLWIWVAIAFFALGYTLLASGIEMRTGAPYLHEVFVSQNPLEALASRRTNYMAYALYPAMIVLMTLTYASLKVIVAVEREPGAVSFTRARELISERFGITALVTFVYLVLCGLGGACCLIPGLIATVFFIFAPYVSSSRRMSVAAAFRTAMDWARQHTVLVILILGIQVVLALMTLLVQFFAVSAFAAMMGPQGIAIGYVTAWFFGVFVGYFGWLYHGAVIATIERFEAQYGIR